MMKAVRQAGSLWKGGDSCAKHSAPLYPELIPILKPIERRINQ